MTNLPKSIFSGHKCQFQYRMQCPICFERLANYFAGYFKLDADKAEYQSATWYADRVEELIPGTICRMTEAHELRAHVVKLCAMDNMIRYDQFVSNESVLEGHVLWILIVWIATMAVLALAGIWLKGVRG